MYSTKAQLGSVQMMLQTSVCMFLNWSYQEYIIMNMYCSNVESPRNHGEKCGYYENNESVSDDARWMIVITSVQYRLVNLPELKGTMNQMAREMEKV